MQSYKKFGNLRARKFYFPKYKKNIFGENITKECVYFLFLFFELGLKNDPGSPIIHYYSGYDFVLESFALNLYIFIQLVYKILLASDLSKFS